MSGEAPAAQAAPEAVTPAPAPEAPAAEAPAEAPAPAAEKPFDPSARNFRKTMSGLADARAKAAAAETQTSATGQESPNSNAGAEVSASVTAGDENFGAPDPKPAQQDHEKPPPNRLGNARKLYFQRKEAEKKAAEAAQASQSAEERAKQLEADLEQARSAQRRSQDLLASGKMNEALKESLGVDDLETLQRMYLEQEGLQPKNDPKTAELEAKVQELEGMIQERLENERQQQQQAEERAHDERLMAAVQEASAAHPDPRVQKWSKVQGFNEQIFQAVKQHPQYSEEQIYEAIVGGFERMASQMREAGVIGGDAPASKNREKTPVRTSASSEAAPAAKPNERKPVATVPTNSAEAATPEAWDPKRERDNWKKFKRRYGTG